MARFTQIIIGGVEIAAGVLTEVFAPGNPLGFYLIAAGVGTTISGVGTLLNQPQRGLAVGTVNPIAPHNIVYGRAKIGGVSLHFDEHGTDNKYLDIVRVLACHPCAGVDAVLFDNQRVLINKSTGSSYSPQQLTSNIVSAIRTNGVVTVTMATPIFDLQDGDQVQMQGISDATMNGKYYIYSVLNSQTFTYLCGGFNSSSSGGQVKTAYPDYRAKVYFEALLGDHTATFQGMTVGTPYDGDPGNLVTVANNRWTADHKCLGRTVVMLRLHYNDEVFSGGLPQISFRLRGKTGIFDPRAESSGTPAVIARPSTSSNGWGSNGHVGAYEEGVDQAYNWGLNSGSTNGYSNPGNAVDGSATTFASVVLTHTHQYAGCIWAFGATTNPGGSVYLNVLSEIPTGALITKRSAGIWYSIDAGVTWAQMYNQPAHSKTWDAAPLADNQDLSLVRVMAFTDSHDDMAHYVYDIAISSDGALGGAGSTSGYTENAALCTADYLHDPVYGFKAAYTTEIPDAELIAAANLCDERVTLANALTEPRYTVNGAFPVSIRRGEVLQNLLTASAGRLTYAGGQFVIHPAAWPGSTMSIGGYVGQGVKVIMPVGGASWTIWFEDFYNIPGPGPGGNQGLFLDASVTLVVTAGGTATLTLGTHVLTGFTNAIGWNGTWPLTDGSPGPYTIPHTFAPGDEIIIECNSTGTFPMVYPPGGYTWQTGPGSRNPDGLAHALVLPAGSPNTNAPDMRIFAGPFRWHSKVSIRDLFNGVKGTYVSPANGWQASDFPPYAQDAKHGYGGDANLTADGGDRRWLDIQLPFTIYPATAQRLAKIELLRRRQQGNGTFAFNLALYNLTALDVVQMTLPYFGWIEHLLEVNAHRLTINKQQNDERDVTLLGCELDLQETDPSVYSWSPTEELTPQGFQQSGLPDVRNPALPTGLTVSSGPSVAAVGANGISSSRIQVTWDKPVDGYITNGGQMQLRYQIPGDTTWTALPSVDPSVGVAYISGVTDGQQYAVQIRAVNAAGVPTAWQDVGTVTASGSATRLPDRWTFGAGIGAPIQVKVDVAPPWTCRRPVTLVEVYVEGKVYPTGSDLVMDLLCQVNHAGGFASILNSPKITIPAGSSAPLIITTFAKSDFATNDKIRLDVTAIGSGIQGQDFAIQMKFE